MPVKPQRIAIVGNGLAGQVMALALAQRGHACTILGTPAKTPRDDLRTTAIMQDGVDFLTALDVWDAPALQAVPLRTMHLISDTAGIAFDAGEIGLSQFGFNVANAALKDRLAERLAASSDVTMHATTVTAVAFDTTAVITCADGRCVIADLVIGADGRNSVVRAAAGIAVTQTVIDQQALVCVVTSDAPHDLTSTEWYQRGGPFTLVPMPDDDKGQHRMAVVYCDRAAQIAEVSDFSLTDLGLYLTDLSQTRFVNLRVIGDIQVWPVTPQRSASLVAPHAALIGEAAHVLPPLAAQGFNTSLRDIQSLTQVVHDAIAIGLPVGTRSTLHAYATDRALDMRVRGTAVDMLNRFIRQDDKIGRTLHAWGFKALHRVAPLKHLVMRQALAPRAARRERAA